MTKLYLATKEETIRAYKSLAEVSPACTESSSTIDIFQAMATPSRLVCNITNSSIYPAPSGTLTINKTSNDTGTAMFVDNNGRVSTAVFPWSGWQSPGYSNPNLLINWDFRQPVNQRGQSSYTVGAGYMIDMWVTGFDGQKSINIQDGFIEMSSKTTGTWFNISQTLETTLLEGTYTLSFLVDDYTKVNQIYVADANDIFLRGSGLFRSNICTFTFTLDKNMYANKIGLQKKEELNTLKLYAAKLEVGSVSTLALDLMQPPNYAAELRKCRRYLQVIKNVSYSDMIGVIHTYLADAAYFSINVECGMRMTPTISGLETVRIANGTPYFTESSDHLGTVRGHTLNRNVLSGQINLIQNYEIGKDFHLYFDSNTNLILSAEL